MNNYQCNYIRKTDKIISLFPPAKINIFLKALYLREDNYVELVTCMQKISLTDTLIIEITDTQKIEFTQTGYQTDRGENNLVYKSAKLFLKEFNLEKKVGLKIALEKSIPVGAGLGGGSADSAYILSGLTILLELDLDDKIIFNKIKKIAEVIGSDVPFFLYPDTASICRGRGDLIQPIELPKNYYLLLIHPGFNISTSLAYSLLKKGLTKRPKSFKFQNRQLDNGIVHLLEIGNDFQNPIFKEYPSYSKIVKILEQNGINRINLTGSGSILYAYFKEENEAQKISKKLDKYDTWIVRPL